MIESKGHGHPGTLHLIITVLKDVMAAFPQQGEGHVVSYLIYSFIHTFIHSFIHSLTCTYTYRYRFLCDSHVP